jgi:hypothetical protein
MAVIQESMIVASDTLPQPDIRTLEEIEREIAAIQRRKAEFANTTLSALRIVVQAEGETHRAALVQAVRADGPTPSRESLDRAERELREAEEYIAAFDDIYTALATERQGAINRQLQADREANAAERMRLRAALPALEAALHAAQLAINEHAARHQQLINECFTHGWAP